MSCFAALLVSTPVDAKSSEVPQLDLSSLEGRLKAQPLWLRPAVGRGRVSYVPTEWGHASYEFLPSRLFPLAETARVELRRMRVNRGKVVLELSTERLGLGSVALRPEYGRPLTAPLVEMLIWQFLQPSLESVVAPEVIVNRSSGAIHLRTCNHLPKVEESQSIGTLSEAKSLGYHECPVCFWKAPPLHDYTLEKNLGALAVSQYLIYHPVVQSESLGTRVDRVGRRVLDRWPFTLRGYDYRFQVVEGDEPTAIALPAGRVFVSRNLMLSVEGDEELEAVLAHEIAHVERRHGYLQFRRAQNAASISEFIGTLAGVFVLARGGDASTAGVVMDLGRVAAAIASELVLAGYSRDLESEADDYALLFVARSPEGRRSWELVLSKLQAFGERGGYQEVGHGLWDSHHGVQARLAKARGSRMAVFPAGQEFVGLSVEGNELARIRLEAQTIASYARPVVNLNPARSGSISTIRGGTEFPTGEIKKVDEPLSVFAVLSTRPEFEGPATLLEVSIADSTGVRTLRNEQASAVGSADEIAVRLEALDKRGLLRGPVRLVGVLGLPGVTSWIPVKSRAE